MTIHTTVMDYRTSLVDVGVPRTAAADSLSSFARPGTTYPALGAPKLFCDEVIEETMWASSEEMVPFLLKLSPLSKLFATAMDYRTSLVDVGVPRTAAADSLSSFARPGTTYPALGAPKLFCDEVIEETMWASSEEMVPFLLEPSPLSKLLAQLATLQHTPEDERWPDAIWPNAQAFADTQAFILRLPLNVIPLPEINLADDGEVNFLWQSDGVYVDLGFYGTGTCSYFAQGKDGCKIYGDDAPASKGLPLEVMTLFTD